MTPTKDEFSSLPLANAEFVATSKIFKLLQLERFLKSVVTALSVVSIACVFLAKLS